MPWESTGPVNERRRFLEKYSTNLYTISELSEQFGISRTAANNLVKRWRAEGMQAAECRSRAPLNHPNQFNDQAIIEMLLAARRDHPRWGPKTIRSRLLVIDPSLKLPAASTIGNLLKHEGLIDAQPRRRRTQSSGRRPTIVADQPNARWDCDYKGDFLLGNGIRCYPLTLTDGFSRVILAIRALNNMSYADARAELERVFRAHGLPEAFRTDNGTPFAPYGRGRGLSRLGAWLVQNGVFHERTRVASPQDNAQHERMHRTLKAETTRPPSKTFVGQQRRFNAFIRDFNHDRPHQGINLKTPASLYADSTRLYPSRPPSPEYPGHWEKRSVSVKGNVNFKGRILYVGKAVAHSYVGLHEIDDDIWSIHFFDYELGRLDVNTWTVD